MHTRRYLQGHRFAGSLCGSLKERDSGSRMGGIQRPRYRGALCGSKWETRRYKDRCKKGRERYVNHRLATALATPCLPDLQVERRGEASTDLEARTATHSCGSAASSSTTA